MAAAKLAKPAHKPASAKVGPARSYGQAAALRALAVAHPFGPVQAKLTVGPAHDRFETEADTVAERVMRMPEGKIHTVGSALVGGFGNRFSGCAANARRKRVDLCRECRYPTP